MYLPHFQCWFKNTRSKAGCKERKSGEGQFSRSVARCPTDFWPFFCGWVVRRSVRCKDCRGHSPLPRHPPASRKTIGWSCREPSVILIQDIVIKSSGNCSDFCILSRQQTGSSNSSLIIKTLRLIENRAKANHEVVSTNCAKIWPTKYFSPASTFCTNQQIFPIELQQHFPRVERCSREEERPLDGSTPTLGCGEIQRQIQIQIQIKEERPLDGSTPTHG